MTISYLGNAMWKGVAADTKPTTAPTGAMFVEIDTDRVARYNGSAWVFPEFVQNIGSSTYTIYIAGTKVKARNNRTGLVDYSEDNDTITTANVFTNAINNIKNITNVGLDAIQGASLNMLAGHYKCRTTITNDRGTGAGVTAAERNSIAIRGEGKSTILHFTPTSSLTDGLIIKSRWSELRDMIVWGNSNVTNLVKAQGETTTYNGINQHRNDGGIISGIQFHGANSNMVDASGGSGGDDGINSPGPIATQVGLLFNSGEPGSIGAVFFWKIVNCGFVGLGFGHDSKGQLTTTQDILGCDYFYCTVGGRFEQIEHNICNTRFDGNTSYGDIGFWFRPSDDWNPGTGQGALAGITSVANMSFENHKPGCKAIFIEKPDSLTTGPANIQMSNIVTSSLGDSGFDNFPVVDQQPVGNFDYLNMSPWRPLKTVKRFGYTTGQCGSVEFPTVNGASATGVQWNNGFGIMAPPNVRENGTGTVTENNVNGIIRKIITGATANTNKSIQWVQSYHQRTSNMKVNVKFILLQTPNTNTVRAFIGFIRTNNITPPTLFAAPGTDGVAATDPLNGIPGIGLWLDTAVSTTWKIRHNDGTGASVESSMSTPKTADALIHTVDILTHDTSSRFRVMYDNVMTTVGAQPAGSEYATTDVVSTDIPATADRYGWVVWIQNVSGDRSMGISHIDTEIQR